MKWLNTPFHANAMAPGPGGGVDCIHLAQAWLLHIGLIHQPLDLPPYATDWGIHSPHTETLFRSFLNSPTLQGKLTELPYKDSIDSFNHSAVSDPHSPVPCPGDLIAFRTGTSIGHLGILLEPSGNSASAESQETFTKPTHARYPENAEGSSRWEGSKGSTRECINIHDRRADLQDTSHVDSDPAAKHPKENAEESSGWEGFEVRAKECMPILDCSSHPTNTSHADFKNSRHIQSKNHHTYSNSNNQNTIHTHHDDYSDLRVLHCLKPRGVLIHRLTDLSFLSQRLTLQPHTLYRPKLNH